MAFIERCELFWGRCPALFYGLFVYLGAAAAFSFHPALFIPLGALVICKSRLHLMRVACGIAAFLLFWLFAASYVVFPPSWATGEPGFATFEICDWATDTRYGKNLCKLSCHVTEFEAENGLFFAKNIPCKLIWSPPGTRPKADALYYAKASLIEHEGSWSLKLDKERPLQRIKDQFSLVEWRHRAKNSVKELLARYLAPSETRSFLEGVLLGEFHDAYLAVGLSRFGLQHITVVSGFHFSLIAVILAAFFRLILPWKGVNVALLIATTGYLFFIGPSASVIRAYIAVMLVFIGKVLEEKANGLNCLGVGLVVVLSYDPVAAISLSFQLSFLATFAILLLFLM